MKKLLLLFVTMILLQGCWISTKDKTFKEYALSTPQDTLKVYVEYSYRNKLNLVVENKYRALFKSELEEAKMNLKGIEFVNTINECDYILDFSLAVYDESLVALAGLGVIPVKGNVYSVCDLKVKNPKGSTIKRYYNTYEQGIIPHIAFFPLLMTPIPWKSMKVTTMWDTLISNSILRAIEEGILI